MTRGRLGVRLSSVAVLYLVVLTSQLATNVKLEVEGRNGSHLHLLGFVAMFGLGALLMLGVKGRNFLKIRPALWFSVFLLLVAIVANYTSDVSLLAMFVSKYGMVTWLLAGISARLAMQAIKRRLMASGNRRRFWALVVNGLPLAMLGVMLVELRGYAAAPFLIESYQFVAANMTVLFLVSLFAMAAWTDPEHARMSFLFQSSALLFMGTALAYLTSRMNSTSIVFVWILLATLFFVANSVRLGWSRRTVFFVSLAMALLWFVRTGAFDDLMQNTRFREISRGGYMISSVSNRLGLLPTFLDQFGVSPIFGHFEAEVEAGLKPGEYIHSLPISLLTHTGIIGFVLFVGAVSGLLRIKSRSTAEGSEMLARWYFLVVLVVASLTTFFTWIPLWFMIGFMLVPRVPVGQNLMPSFTRRDSGKLDFG